MKYLSFILCSLLVTVTVAAQTSAEVEAPYKKDPKIPAFRLLQTDSTTWFAKADLPKNYDYTAIIFFSPDCGHCQYLTTELLKSMDSLKNVFFVLAAYRDMKDIKDFYNKYNLAAYPNIRVGRDQTYIIPSFYHVTYTPFVAVYDKKGTLVTVYDPPVHPVMEVPQLVALVNKK